MKRFPRIAVAAVLLLLGACRSSEPAPPASSPADTFGVDAERILTEYITAAIAGNADVTAAMFAEGIRSHPDFNRYHEVTDAGIRSLGVLLELEELTPVRHAKGITHVFHVEFADSAGRVFINVDSVDGLLHGLFFEPFADGQTEDPRDRFESHLFELDSRVLPYRLLKPVGFDAARRYPLVLFLHGAGQRGDDNIRQVQSGIWGFSDPDVRQRFPAFVVAPQCPLSAQWVDTPWGDAAHDMPETPTWPLRLTMDLLDALQTEFPIDPDRIYVTGLSMGGFGTWDAIQRWPDRFAAAVPICGGGDPAYAAEIADVPVWAFHGDRDTVVKVQRSRDMIAAIRAAGGEPRYTEYPGVGHGSWEPAYRDRELYAWLFDQKLSNR